MKMNVIEGFYSVSHVMNQQWIVFVCYRAG